MNRGDACYCRGAIDDGRPRAGSAGRHVVYVAFLNYYTQQQYERERWLYDYTCCPINWLTVVWQGAPFYHVQIMFWAHEERASITYSVDATRGVVFCARMKQFANEGWTFMRFDVTRDQEMAADRFLRAQIGRPFNRGVYGIFCFGTASPGGTGGPGKSWYCAELVVAALQAMGLLRDIDAATVTPGLLYELIVASRAELRVTEDVRHVVRHQQFWTTVRDANARARR